MSSPCTCNISELPIAEDMLAAYIIALCYSIVFRIQSLCIGMLWGREEEVTIGVSRFSLT
jgi:hypothetical protein